MRYDAGAGAGAGAGAAVDPYTNALSLIANSTMSLFGSGSLTTSNVLEGFQRSLVAISMVNDRVTQQSTAVVALESKLKDTEKRTTEMETDVLLSRLDSLSAMDTASVAVKKADEALFKISELGSSGGGDTATGRLRDFCKTTNFAWPSLCILYNWNEWRSQQHVNFEPRVPAYGSMFAEGSDGFVALSPQVFRSSAFAMFPGECATAHSRDVCVCVSHTLGYTCATNANLETLAATIDPAMRIDARNDCYDISLQQNRNPLILRMRKQLFEDAMRFVAACR